MRDENQQRSAITPENYRFHSLLNYEKTDAGEFYVLDAQPRSKNKFLFRGQIWVDAKDFAITKVEGEPAVKPSWWTVKTGFERPIPKNRELLAAPIQRERNQGARFGTRIYALNIAITRSRRLAEEQWPRPAAKH